MIRRLALVGLVLSLGACADGSNPVIEATEVGKVVGVVVEYQGDLLSVESFTVRTSDGELFKFVPAPDGEFGFPLPHLKEHLATSEPVDVRYVNDGDQLVARIIVDARP